MFNTTVPSAGPKGALRSTWMTMGIVALMAVMAGLLVPQLLPGEVVLSTPKTEPANKSKGNYTAPTLPDMPNPQGMLTRLALGTLLVLGLSVISIVAMRRWMQPQQMVARGQQTLRLLETLPLGNRCSVHLVHLGKREILIGMDGTGIKTIVPLPEAFADVMTQTPENNEG